MAYISKRNKRKEKDKQIAADNRRELIAAGFRRRDLLKMGLLTSAGMLIPKKGLSARPLNTRGSFDSDEPNSPPTTPFQELMPRLPVLQPVPLSSLNPQPTAAPNTAAGGALNHRKASPAPMIAPHKMARSPAPRKNGIPRYSA